MTTVHTEVEPFAFAARRDASFLRSPGRAEVYHVDDGKAMAGCTRARPNVLENSSRRNPMLAEFTRVPVAEVPEGQRCRRAGCRRHWPEAAK